MTGWDTGLCQDYCRELSLWFASRLDARQTIRRNFGACNETHQPVEREEKEKIQEKVEVNT